MNRLKFVPAILLTAGLVAVSCTNLDENLKDQWTPANYGKTSSEQDALLAAMYGPMFNNYGHNGYFTLMEVSTDEAMIPQRGGDWYDGGQPQGIHTHFQSVSSSKPEGFDVFNNTWTNAFSGIAACNRLIVTPGIAEAADKVAELKVMRAWYYYYLMDLFGNVPLSTKLGENQGQKTSAQMYAFIESELTTNVPLLTKNKNYGRLTYWAGQAILGKLYLNAAVYTGTQQYAKAATALDDIINNGGFGLEANYRDVFVANNAGSKEHIWAVPFDHLYGQGFNLDQMTLHYGSQDTYKLQQQPWNGYCSLEEFYKSYDPTDKRRKSFIVGQQYKADGVTPVTDGSFEGAAKGDSSANLFFTVKVNELYPNALRQSGARLGKFEFAIGATPNMDNDFPVFRYGAVLMDRAECYFRLANNWNDPTGVAMVNQMAARNGVTYPAAGNTADTFLAERGRELFSEAWRRQDLIRYGQFTKTWFGKPAVDDAHVNIWPIPLAQLTATAGSATALKQNPGY